MSDVPIDHEQTLRGAAIAAGHGHLAMALLAFSAEEIELSAAPAAVAVVTKVSAARWAGVSRDRRAGPRPVA